MANVSKPISCKIAVAIANPVVRRAMADEFRHRGADDVLHVTEWDALAETLKGTIIDILVLDDVLQERQTGPLIRMVRHGDLHEHPFPLVITLAHQQEERQLRELIDCGPDAIVLTPVSISDLFTKIERLAISRKPFVITRDYIGPDRRGAPREGAAPPIVIQAPNPLADNHDPDVFRQALTQGVAQMKAGRIECSLGQLAWALRSGDASAFADLVPVVDHLAKSTSKMPIKMAAEGLTEALKSQVADDIMAWGKKLLAAAARA